MTAAARRPCGQCIAKKLAPAALGWAKPLGHIASAANTPSIPPLQILAWRGRPAAEALLGADHRQIVMLWGGMKARNAAGLLATQGAGKEMHV
jgi:hypothetical protein